MTFHTRHLHLPPTLSSKRLLRAFPPPLSKTVFLLKCVGRQCTEGGNACSQSLNLIILRVNTLYELPTWLNLFMKNRWSKEAGLSTRVAESQGFGDFRVESDYFLHRTPKFGLLSRAFWNGTISFETFIETRVLAAHHDFHRLLVATKSFTAKLHSRYVKESVSKILEARSRNRTFYLRLSNLAVYLIHSKQVEIKVWLLYRGGPMSKADNYHAGYALRKTKRTVL